MHYDLVIWSTIGSVWVIAIAVEPDHFLDQRLWEVLNGLIGVLVMILGAIIRKLFVSKADKADVLALSKSLEQLRLDKYREHAEIVASLKEMLFRMHEENKDAIRVQANSMNELSATIRLLTQQIMQHRA